MKKTFLFISLVLVAGTLIPQNAKTYPEPDIQEKPYYYYEPKNILVELQYGSLNPGERMTGFGTDEELYYTEGEKSTVRIKKEQKIYFIFKWSSDDVDPAKMFHLMKMTVNPKKKRREIVTAKGNNWTKSSNTSNTNIFFKTKKVQQIMDPENPEYPLWTIRMITVENLEPGEYVWEIGGSTGVGGCFGVDENAAPPVVTAQSPKPNKKYPELEAYSRVFYYAEAANEAEDLQTAYLEINDRSTGFKTEESILSTPGKKSPVRYKKSPEMDFIVRMETKIDPMVEFRLYKLTTNEKKDRRECVTSKSEHWLGTVEAKHTLISFAHFKVMEKEEWCERIFTVKNLEPGEYVWVRGWGNSDAYFFGVD